MTQIVMSLDKRLGLFLGSWRRISAEAGYMDRRFPLVKLGEPLTTLGPSAIPVESSKGSTAPSLIGLTTVLLALAPMLLQARQQGCGLNVWETAGLRRGEFRNAAVLAGLWSTPTMGERAMIFLNAFLSRLQPADALPSLDELTSGYVVRTEHCATGAATERVDITVEGKSFVLGIEVKIDAGEGPEQLTRYRQSVQDWGRARGKRGAVVLLAPFRTAVPNIVQADWRDIVAAARSTLPPKRTAFTYSDRLIDDFARHALAFQGAKQ